MKLQIELGNDHAVTLGISKNSNPPSVNLWCGSGEHSFVKTDIEPGETLDYFKAWLQCCRQREGDPCHVAKLLEGNGKREHLKDEVERLMFWRRVREDDLNQINERIDALNKEVEKAS